MLNGGGGGMNGAEEMTGNVGGYRTGAATTRASNAPPAHRHHPRFT